MYGEHWACWGMLGPAGIGQIWLAKKEMNGAPTSQGTSARVGGTESRNSEHLWPSANTE